MCQTLSQIKIYHYTEACYLAFINKWDIEILPEQKKIIVKKEKENIGEFLEIGNLIFILEKKDHII